MSDLKPPVARAWIKPPGTSVMNGSLRWRGYLPGQGCPKTIVWAHARGAVGPLLAEATRPVLRLRPLRVLRQPACPP